MMTIILLIVDNLTLNKAYVYSGDCRHSFLIELNSPEEIFMRAILSHEQQTHPPPIQSVDVKTNNNSLTHSFSFLFRCVLVP